MRLPALLAASWVLSVPAAASLSLEELAALPAAARASAQVELRAQHEGLEARRVAELASLEKERTELARRRGIQDELRKRSAERLAALAPDETWPYPFWRSR